MECYRNSLSFCTKVEILYTLQEADIPIQKFWWPANMTRISYVEESRGAILSASIEFDASHRLRSSVQHFTLSNDNETRHQEGTLYS